MTRSEQIELQAKSLVEEFAKEQVIDPKEVQGLGMWFNLGWADEVSTATFIPSDAN